MGNELQTSANPKNPTDHSEITVVNAAAKSSSSLVDDNDLNKLLAIPKFLPILRSSINVPNDPAQLPHIDSEPLLQLSMRLQTHLRLCSETVQNDQLQLIQRMKEADTRSHAVQQRLLDKQKRFSGYCDQSKKLTEVVKSLKRLDQSLTELANRMRAINLLLPNDEQLPTLAFRK